MSKANRDRRARERQRKRDVKDLPRFIEAYFVAKLTAPQKEMVTIAEYYTKTERRRYILHDDGRKTLLDVSPYWNGQPPFVEIPLEPWPWDAAAIPPGTELKTGNAIAYLGNGGYEQSQ